MKELKKLARKICNLRFKYPAGTQKLLAIWVSAATLMQVPCLSGKQLTAAKAQSILKGFPSSWHESPLGGNN